MAANHSFGMTTRKILEDMFLQHVPDVWLHMCRKVADRETDRYLLRMTCLYILMNVSTRINSVYTLEYKSMS